LALKDPTNELKILMGANNRAMTQPCDETPLSTNTDMLIIDSIKRVINIFNIGSRTWGPKTVPVA